jgi:hypothetical protein
VPSPEEPGGGYRVARQRRALHLLIDSIGIKVEGEGEWHARKHGGTNRRVWRKIHLAIDERTLEVCAVEVTSSNVGDAPMLPELLDQIPKDQKIGSVTADGAYDTRKCHDAIAKRGADAVIPTRKNARPWKPDTIGARARSDILRATKHLGRSLWRRWSDYHRRSRVETKMNCLKLLDGSSWPETSTARSPKSRSALPCSTAIPRSESRSPRPLHKSTRKNANRSLSAYCATAPARYRTPIWSPRRKGLQVTIGGSVQQLKKRACASALPFGVIYSD